MHTPIHKSQPPAGPERVRRPPEGELRARVWTVLGAIYPQGNPVERRSQRRYPYPYLLLLTPVADDGITPEGESVVVVGKHLSEQGLGFYHPGPLPYRRMIASLETASGTRLDFLIDVTWCRFTKQGWYESGGRFLPSTPESMERANPSVVPEASTQQAGERTGSELEQ